MRGGYLVPANAKRGTLYFNIFRGIDLIIFASGIIVSVFMLGVFSSSNLIVTCIEILPGAICGLLVFPIPNYHNVLCALQSIYRFYTERRRYSWRGWCFYEQFKATNGKK